MLETISPGGGLLALVYFVIGVVLASLGARRNSGPISITLGVGSCAVMILTASPSDLADGQYGIAVFVEFLIVALFSFAGMKTVALVLRKLGHVE